jgi:hypothetical protein
MSMYGSDREDGKVETGSYGELTVGTSAIEAKVGASPLDKRTYISIRPKDSGVYWGLDSSVTPTTGTRIFKNELLILPFDSALSLYLVADGTNKKVSVVELGNDPEGGII